MNLFESTTFDFGQTQNGFKWYLKSNIPLWHLELKQIVNDIADILRQEYNPDPPEDIRCYPISKIDTALEHGFPICIMKDFIVCTYLITTSTMYDYYDMGDAKDECKMCAEKLSKKYSYLTENVNQLELSF
jgi:hypothetical protein